MQKKRNAEHANSTRSTQQFQLGDIRVLCASSALSAFHSVCATTPKGVAPRGEQRYNIFWAAYNSGEWTYTQRCAQCAGGPNSESAKNLPARLGDCTDYVYSAVKSVLGSAWVHEILRTKAFNISSAATLAWYGSQQIDSASVRIGDVVVRTKTSACLCGHAGIFFGWAAGGHPIGIANNGSPASPGHENANRPTGPFDFRVKSGYVTKFFRPQTP